MNYATLYEFRQYRKLATNETGDDDLITDLLTQASRFIDGIRRCDARYEARLFDYPGVEKSDFGVYAQPDFSYTVPSELRLDDDLLSVTTLTNGDGESISSSDYFLRPNNMYPKHGIKLKSSSGENWQMSSDGDLEQCITVAGIWGYHPDYDERAWESSGDTNTAAITTTTETSITVSDVDGKTIYNQPMRFQVGQMIRIDSEYMLITATNPSLNTLTVVRGYNSTTAATHLISQTIYIYRPYYNIKRACLRLTAWLYTQKDTTQFDRLNVLGDGLTITPTQLPDDIAILLPPRRPMGIRG